MIPYDSHVLYEATSQTKFNVKYPKHLFSLSFVMISFSLILLEVYTVGVTQDLLRKDRNGNS